MLWCLYSKNTSINNKNGVLTSIVYIFSNNLKKIWKKTYKLENCNKLIICRNSLWEITRSLGLNTKFHTQFSSPSPPSQNKKKQKKTKNPSYALVFLLIFNICYKHHEIYNVYIVLKDINLNILKFTKEN
jgi:hypothetical protein